MPSRSIECVLLSAFGPGGASSSCRLGCDLGSYGGRPLDDEEFVLPPFLRRRETPAGVLPQGAYPLVQLGSRPYGTRAAQIGGHADKPTGTR